MQLQASIEIRAPAERVFEVVSTPERLPEWNEAVLDARRSTPGSVGPGARAEMRGRVLGQAIASETEVVAFEPPLLFATKAVRGPRLHTTFRLARQASGTRLDVELRGEPPGGALGGLVAERILRTQLTRSLQQLRTLCEREALTSQVTPKESESC
jgi:uncharacterized protein YndB with AHSA1/START domain